jgi:hypothetical protein
MSVTANGPDGSTFSFPDGTPQEVVRGVLAKHYGWPDAPPAAPARMARFRLQGPDGNLYNVEAPDAESAVAALHGSGQTPASTAGAAPVEDKGELSVNNVVRSLANGITFGGADRLAAFLGSKTGVGGEAGDYEGNLAKQRDLTNAYASEHPIANAAGNIVGNVGGMAAAATIPAVAAALPDAAPTMLGKIGQGMAGGAAVGAVQGVNDAPDWSNVGDTVDTAAKGAGTGAAFGFGAPILARGVGKSYSALADALRGYGGGLSRPAGKVLAQGLSEAAPGEVDSALQTLGPDAMLVDAAPSLLGKGQGALGNSAEARNILASALKAREAGAPTRLAADTNENFGTAVSPTSATRDILDHRSALDAQNYGAALDGSGTPPVADGYRRFYRGVGNNYSEAPGTTSYFADTPERAAQFGDVHYVDVPNTKDGLRYFVQGSHKPGDYLASNEGNDLVSRLQPYVKGGAAPAVDAQPVVDLIDDHLKTAVGEQKKALTRLRAEIMEPNPELPENMPVSAAPPMPGKPQTLVNFLQNAGGVRDDGGDLSSLGLNRFPGLVTKNGLAPDRARELAHEAGYLGDGSSESINDTYIHDLIDKLQSHPTYSAHDSDMLEAWNAANDARTDPHGNRMTAAQYRARYVGPGEGEAPLPAQVPTTNARKLHGLKMELDNVIEHDQPGLGVQAGALKSQNRSLTMARGAINDALEAQVPGYARANAISAPLAKRAEAVASGTKLLGSGPETPWPVDLAAQRATMTPGERAAQAMGLRGRVEEKFARTANDVTAGKAIAGGLGDFNRGNLSEVFGQEPTDRFIAAVDREKKFGDTHNRLIGNSETDPRSKAAAAMAPAKIGTIHSVAQVGLKAVHALTSPAIKAILPDITKSYPEVARALSAQGPERDAVLRALREHSATSGRAAVKGQSYGNRAALAAALLADGALHSGPSQRRSQGNSR